MGKIKAISMALLVSAVLLMATGCSCTADTNDMDNTGTTNNSTTKSGGLVDDIGDDIQSGINDIGTELDVTRNTSATNNQETTTDNMGNR